MNDEIKEILELFGSTDENIMFCDIVKLNSKQSHLLLDYITNLQQENKEWGMIFDTFSSRPYAHKYLEEKRKELGNKRIMGLDSEMIYKEYYDLKEIEQGHKETNATLMYELAKLKKENEVLKKKLDRRYYKNECKRLEQENERLKEQLEYLRSGEYLNQVKWERDLNENLNQTLGIELEDYKSRCEKINEILKESPNFNYSNDYIILKRRIEDVLQNGSDSQ